MEWKEAIKESKFGSATRVHRENPNKKLNRKIRVIRHKDGSAYRLVSEGGKVNFDLSGEALVDEYSCHYDWKPS